MTLFYLLTLMPLVTGGILFFALKRIHWIEWLGGFGLSLLIAAIFHGLAVMGMTQDVQTFSGQIYQAKHFSRWLEYYEYAVYRTETRTTTDSDGNIVMYTEEVFDHWEPTQRWHEEEFRCYSNIDTEYRISEADFLFYVRVFNHKATVPGTRTTSEHASRMLEGDPNDYESSNTTGYIQPITDVRKWSNKVKACPSVFSYIQPSTNIPVYAYPVNNNPFHSNRLLGEAPKHFSLLELDRLNARLGPRKRVNVIIAGFGSQPSSIAQDQESKWIGGKKNDLVICYGSEGNSATWVRVFGWTEQDVCKRNLETILLDNPLNNDLLPKIEQEIKNNYLIKDWKKFDYLTIEPPMWSYIVFFFVLVATQGGYWWFAYNNELEKGCIRRRNHYNW